MKRINKNNNNNHYKIQKQKKMFLNKNILKVKKNKFILNNNMKLNNLKN